MTICILFALLFTNKTVFIELMEWSQRTRRMIEVIYFDIAIQTIC